MMGTDLRVLSARLHRVRAFLIKKYPFFGYLMMHLGLGFSDCGTACTNMRQIIFDPEFAKSLNDEQLGFVMLHELMHCALKHCTRGAGKHKLVYNIACDIVVNSIIMDIMGVQEFTIAGEKVMHKTPEGGEGKLFNAEEVYRQLLRQADVNELESFGALDNHQVWDALSNEQQLEVVWDKNLRDTVSSTGLPGNIPGELERAVDMLCVSEKVDWKHVLHDFLLFDEYDYDFLTPDKRFNTDFILPSFKDGFIGSGVKGVWFAVDASGSVSNAAMNMAFAEIKSATEQVGSLSGFVSFFDTKVSEPFAFENVEELSSLKPVGGGGTSFMAVFDYMKEYFEELPEAIVIITDGYADFPKEEEALNVPVIWIIADSNVEAPWGECVHIKTK